MSALRHLVSLGSWGRGDVEALLDRAHALQEGAAAPDSLGGCILVNAFYEPSTRTRLSFESAACRLGMPAIGFADAGATSTAKGESLEDTVRVLCAYGDVLVLRHPEAGAAARAAAVADVPVVNAGDGAGEHPTQALVDLYTLRRHFGSLDGLRVALVGDLRYGRTVHSLLPELRRFGATAVAVPAPGLGLPEGLADGVHVQDLEAAAASCDVLYLTRLQRERVDRSASVAALPRVDRGLLERTRSRAVVLHPLPRVDELDPDVDALAAAKYFEQARNGVAVRMAVLEALLEGRA